MFIETKNYGYVNSNKIINMEIQFLKPKDYKEPDNEFMFSKIKEDVEFEFKVHGDIGFLVCVVAHIDGYRWPAFIEWKHSHSEGVDAYKEMEERLSRIVKFCNSHA